MAWFFLVIAGLFEVAWAIGLKYTEGFSKLVPSVLTVFAMLASFLLLGVALRTIPVGTGYGVWVGIGIVGTVILGIVLFDEPVNVSRMVFVLFIVVGVLGLKITTAT